MSRSRETINAAMLAAAIRIDARFESDIGAFVVGDDRFGFVFEILSRPTRFFVRVRIVIYQIDVRKIDMEFFETIGWTPRRATAVNRLSALRRFLDDGS